MLIDYLAGYQTGLQIYSVLGGVTIYEDNSFMSTAIPHRGRAGAHLVLAVMQAYRPQYYYYEVIECARRLLLTGCLVFILPNSVGQAAVACVLATVTVCIFIMLRPFLDEMDYRAYVLGCLVIFMSM